MFGIITQRQIKTGKRLILDLEIARQAYAAPETCNIALISGEDNPLDLLTKLRPNKVLLKHIQTKRTDHKKLQYTAEPAHARNYI